MLQNPLRLSSHSTGPRFHQWVTHTHTHTHTHSLTHPPTTRQVQIERTIWSKVDESTVHNVMDLKQFEEKFSAYQRKETAETSGLMAGGTLRRRSVLDRPKEMSVIESKRAQNCSIVLSTLKMSNDEVRNISQKYV